MVGYFFWGGVMGPGFCNIVLAVLFSCCTLFKLVLSLDLMMYGDCFDVPTNVLVSSNFA